MSRVFIGVAWPYANGVVHIGHLASTYVPADQFARYQRLRGNDVLMVSGSDVHGTAILVAAEKAGTTPAELSSKNHATNRAVFERLGITWDVFTTTRTVLHERTVQEVFLRLLEHGYLQRRTEQGPYCPKHARFLPDRYLTGTCPHCGYEHARGDECDHCGRPLEARQLGNPRCALCGTPAEFRDTEQFYLELDRLAPKVAEYVGQQTHWRPGTRRVALNFLEEGLHPTAITRDLEWGIPIPLDGYAAKCIYVWFEAVIGYLSASKEWAVRAGDADAWRRFWDEREPARQYYFVGKDNKFHHTILWPAILTGVGGLPLPYDVPANEWLLLGTEKLSKSRSEEQALFAPALLERYPPDVIRFYVGLLAPQNRDTEFDPAEFAKLREEVLANQYGNLVQRALVMARDRFDGKIPTPPPGWDPHAAGGLGAHLADAHRRIAAEFEAVRLKEALDLALEEVRAANRRFHEGKPWQASPVDRARIVYETLWSIQALAVWLAPTLPFSSDEVFRMLGYPRGPGAWDQALAPPPAGQPLGPVHPLFPRDPPVATPPPAAAPPSVPAPTGPVPLSIRAGVVRSAVPHPSADKLYVLEVDLGEATPRTIVAGLRSSYSPEELVGRRVSVLANLAPRTIRRMTSQGMVLAVDDGEKAVLLSPPDSTPPGALARGARGDDRTIAYEEFASVPLFVGRVTEADASRSRLDLGGRSVTVSGPWPVGSERVVRLAAPDSDQGDVLEFESGGAPQPIRDVRAGAKVR